MFSDHFVFKLAGTSHFDQRTEQRMFAGLEEDLEDRDFNVLSPFINRNDTRSHAYVQAFRPTNLTELITINDQARPQRNEVDQPHSQDIQESSKRNYLSSQWFRCRSAGCSGRPAAG